VTEAAQQRVVAIVELLEQLFDLGVVHRAAIAVLDQVLLADIGDIGAFLILGEEVVIGLFAPGTKILGDLLVPFLAVGEDGVDVEHHAAKIILTVANDVADGKIGTAGARHLDTPASLGRKKLARSIAKDIGAAEGETSEPTGKSTAE
jgi:hypothetical protein